MHLLIVFAVIAGQHLNVECIWVLQNYELLSCCRILIPELAKYEQEETSCSVPAVRTRMQMTCWPMRRQQHGTLTNQWPETRTDPSYLNIFSKCLFPGDGNKWSKIKIITATTSTTTTSTYSFLHYDWGLSVRKYERYDLWAVPSFLSGLCSEADPQLATVTCWLSHAALLIRGNIWRKEGSKD